MGQLLQHLQNVPQLFQVLVRQKLLHLFPELILQALDVLFIIQGVDHWCASLLADDVGHIVPHQFVVHLFFHTFSPFPCTCGGRVAHGGCASKLRGDFLPSCPRFCSRAETSLTLRWASRARRLRLRTKGRFSPWLPAFLLEGRDVPHPAVGKSRTEAAPPNRGAIFSLAAHVLPWGSGYTTWKI